MSARGSNGALLGFLALGTPFALAGAATLAAQPALFDLLRRADLRAYIFAGIGAYALFALLCSRIGSHSQRMPRGAPGRLQGAVLGHMLSLFALSVAISAALLYRAAPQLPVGAPISLQDALLLFPRELRVALIGNTAAIALSGLGSLGALISCWFLLPEKLRRVLFWLVDVSLLAACVWLSFKFTFRPASAAPEALAGPTARLLTTFLLGVRVGTRLLPHGLDLIETFNFRSLVAARHLRAKKSGFLAAISFLSILAVSVSSCALTTTLSVMGGFRQDLKHKILGNNAHIVIDRAENPLERYEAMVARTRAVKEVRGASPYVSGEVMISSASNLAGAVLRGIDTAHIGEVSELPENIERTGIGSLDYLAHPEKLARLPASQLGLSIGLPNVKRFATDSDAAAKPDGKQLLKQIEDMLDDADGEERGDDPTQKKDLVEPAPAPPSPPENTLPGIVVGQELARSLRLYLGDEVNVVTPLGELGPTGPMPKSRPFRVAGIFYSGMYEYDMKFAYVTLASAQKFLGAANTASGIEVTVREPDRAQEVANNIASALGQKGLRVRGWQELNKNLFGALALEKLAMFIALGIAILVASFCIVGTLTLMVQEKGREVAVLKAMGAADRAIVAIFVIEGTLIGVFGSLLGLALGYVACFAMEHFGVRLNPEVYYIDRLPVHIDSSEFIAVGIAAVVVCLIVTIYPAQLASRLRPVDALRYE